MTLADVKLSVAPMNGTLKRIVEAQVGDLMLRDTIDTNTELSRRRFIRKIADRFKLGDKDLGGLDSKIVELADAADAEVERQALESAASDTNSTAPVGLGPELDVTRIIRPERFITPAVSGISVAAIGGDLGQPMPHWRVYLGRAGGRRECNLLGSTIHVPGSSPLFVCPQPSPPAISLALGWSSEGRQA